MTNENKIVASNIKLLRTLEGITQEEFGKQFGSNQKSVWAYEQGHSKPKSGFMLKLSKKVGISPEILLSVKLKADRAGSIVNLPRTDKQIQEIRSELKKAIGDYKIATDAFVKTVLSINERIEQLEKKGKK